MYSVRRRVLLRRRLHLWRRELLSLLPAPQATIRSKGQPATAPKADQDAQISSATLERPTHGAVIDQTFTNCTLNINFNKTCRACEVCGQTNQCKPAVAFGFCLINLRLRSASPVTVYSWYDELVQIHDAILFDNRHEHDGLYQEKREIISIK